MGKRVWCPLVASVRTLTSARMSVVLIILKIYILVACWSSVIGNVSQGHTGHQEAYVRLVYPTHSDINLELYHPTRIHRNGGPVLPKPIAFRQPSFVITSFQADLHRPANNETHAAQPAYVIKPFKAQLLEHELGFTADGRVAPSNSQVPSPDPVELSVLKGESLKEKVTMPLVLEANSRRRHFSATVHNLNSNPLANSSSLPSALYLNGSLTEKKKEETPSNNFSLPPYPLSRLSNHTSSYEVVRRQGSSKKHQNKPTKQRSPPTKTHIQSLLKQLLEVARDFHSSEATDDSSVEKSVEVVSNKKYPYDVTAFEEEPIKEEEVLSYQHFFQHPVQTTSYDSTTQLTPLSTFVPESAGSRGPITSTHSTFGSTYTDPSSSTATPQRGQEEFLNVLSSYQEQPLKLEEPEETHNEHGSESTTLIPTFEATYFQRYEPEFNQTDVNADHELKMPMEDVAVYHSAGPVSISSPYSGSRVFSMDSPKIDSPVNGTTGEPRDITFGSLPIQIESENSTSAISASLKTEHLANATYRERVVKIASLYIAELIANVMALGHQHAKVSEIAAHVTERPSAVRNESIKRPEPLEERETERPVETKPETIGAVRETVTAGRPLFVVEAKTSYVFPTDTPVPVNNEKVHRQEYHTLVESVEDEDEDAVESAQTFYQTPHELMRGVRNRRS